MSEPDILDCDSTDNPVCPWCGWEIDATDFRGNNETWDCPNCRQPVEIEAEYSRTFTTTKGKPRRPQAPNQ